MERNIRPCKSKSGKWKRLAKLKTLATPYSNSNRRQVQRFRSCPPPSLPAPDDGFEESSDEVFNDFQNFQRHTIIETHTTSSSGTLQHTESPAISCNLECIQVPETADDSIRSLPNPGLISAIEGPDQDTWAQIHCLELLGKQTAVPLNSISLQEKLMSFISCYKLSNVAANKLLRIIKCTTAEDLRQLPKNFQSLENNVLSASSDFLLQWLCSNKTCQRLLHVKINPGEPRQTKHYFMHAPLAEARNNELHRQICEKNDFSRPNVTLTRGILGKSPMLGLPYLDMINDFPPCFLHTIYLGVARTFTQFLLTDVNIQGKIGRDALQRLTDNLLLIRPPHRVSRTPRSFSENSHWKGHEWGMWLMCYSPILLNKVIPTVYWHHWIHLVYGCSMILKSSRGVEKQIIEQRISSASDSFEIFSRDVAQLYGTQACRFNVHLLRHLPKLASLWGGDLLNSTMAPFETYNGVLQGFVNNSQHISYQIGMRYWRSIHINEESPSPLKDNCMSQLHNYQPPEGVTVPNTTGSIIYYSRFRTSANKTFYSEHYRRSTLRYSAWVKLTNGKFAEVQAFAKTDRYIRHNKIVFVCSFRDTESYI
ncbi:unnamed protein product [Allacma fusca]|uniref:Uncharacterized protein n=1 Tax=Allacma fusca TaxID=39272 RepID=A0A8J2KNS0_9HEXA|nr:unnamed protein product [Allacma fusca]